MTRLQLRAIGMVLSLAANLATAGESHYNCVVLSATELSEDGKLVSSALVKSQIGEQFTVDRLTGRVLGGPLDKLPHDCGCYRPGFCGDVVSGFFAFTECAGSFELHPGQPVCRGDDKALRWNYDTLLFGRLLW